MEDNEIDADIDPKLLKQKKQFIKRVVDLVGSKTKHQATIRKDDPSLKLCTRIDLYYYWMSLQPPLSAKKDNTSDLKNT